MIQHARNPESGAGGKGNKVFNESTSDVSFDVTARSDLKNTTTKRIGRWCQWKQPDHRVIKCKQIRQAQHSISNLNMFHWNSMAPFPSRRFPHLKVTICDVVGNSHNFIGKSAQSTARMLHFTIVGTLIYSGTWSGAPVK